MVFYFHSKEEAKTLNDLVVIETQFKNVWRLTTIREATKKISSSREKIMKLTSGLQLLAGI